MPSSCKAPSLLILLSSLSLLLALLLFFPSNPLQQANDALLTTRARRVRRANATKDEFLDNLISQMTVEDLTLQLHLMFADDIIGPNSDNAQFDSTLHLAPSSGIGVIHDWYPTNISQYNTLQSLNLAKSRLHIPLLQFAECLHGVGSFKQSLFPQSIGMSASFDTALVHTVGRAIGKEASSIGVHACLSPVLDLGKDTRFGRIQEAWGEDYVLTSHMGVAYASGLSKNGSWSDLDAVVPIMKHFAAHGSPQGGRNAASWMGRGNRQIHQEMLTAFKAAFDLGGVRGVMMAYSELDEVPCHINPILYKALESWGFDGIITADDTGILQLQTGHHATTGPADDLTRWFNAGGQIQYYDFPLDVFINTTKSLVSNASVSLRTLQSRARRVLSVKYDLGLFDHPFIPEDGSVNASQLTVQHKPLALDAARKSIVLLENRNGTLPIRLEEQGIGKIALVGPFVDVPNYGDYSGPFGSTPIDNAVTLLQAVQSHLSSTTSSSPKVELTSAMGANSWMYNQQYNIPPYHFSPSFPNNTSKDPERGALLATYFATPNFTSPLLTELSTPALDWGLYPPHTLPSNNFSVIWSGSLHIPTSLSPSSGVKGYLGIAISPNTTASLYIDDSLLTEIPATLTGNIQGNILPLDFVRANGTQAPAGGVPFTFVPGKTHKIRVEYRVWNTYQKVANVNSVNARIELFWNLVDREDPVGQAVKAAESADLIVLAVGAAWNSDGESGDRATLGLSPNQTRLADAIFDLGKPVVLVLQGGRTFAIPEYYGEAAAVLSTFFPGQSGGQAISDVLFGKFNPGGRMPLSVPCDSATLPVYYNYKPTDHIHPYLDICTFPTYSFGHGISYTNFSITSYTTSSNTFSSGSTIKFEVSVKNIGNMSGSYVPQIYLLGRISPITRSPRQLMAFARVYVDPGETQTVTMDLEVDRYLRILNLEREWELERGNYTFALLEHSAANLTLGRNLTLTCV